MTRFILISGGKGGVGKSTSAINLAAALTYFGKDTTIIDANLTTPNIGIYLGAPIVPINLHHVLQGKHPIREAVYEHPSGTKLVPGSLSIEDLRLTNPKKLQEVIPRLKNTTDFAIIDCAAGLGKEVLSAIQSTDEVIIVTNPELPAVTDALKTIKIAEEYNKKVLGIVLTKYQNSKTDMPLKNIEALLEKKIISIIPEDASIRKSIVAKDPVVLIEPNSAAAIAYKKLASSLIGREYNPEKDIKKQKLHIRLLKKFGF